MLSPSLEVLMTVIIILHSISISHSTDHHENILKAMKILNWKNVVLTSNLKSVFRTKELKAYNFFWKFADYQNENHCQHEYIIYKISNNSELPFGCLKNPFASILINFSEKETVLLKNHAKKYGMMGFYTFKQHSLKICLANFDTLHCMDYSKQFKYDFEGFKLNSLFGTDGYGDENFLTEIATSIGTFYNFTIKFIEAERPNDWGMTPSPNSNISDPESYSGMYKAIALNRYDFLSNSYFITHGRQATTSFLHPVSYFGYGLYIDLGHLPKGYDWKFFFRYCTKHCYMKTVNLFSTTMEKYYTGWSRKIETVFLSYELSCK